MPIEYATGDMWERYGEPGTIMVLAANCAGVMGAGQVKPYPKREPAGYATYQKFCRMQPLGPIRMGTVLPMGGENGSALIFPTMAKPGMKSSESWIIKGCQHWVRLMTDRPWNRHWTWLVPMLGCGIGGLDPERVTAILVEHLAPVEGQTFVLYQSLKGEKR